MIRTARLNNKAIFIQLLHWLALMLLVAICIAARQREQRCQRTTQVAQ